MSYSKQGCITLFASLLLIACSSVPDSSIQSQVNIEQTETQNEQSQGANKADSEYAQLLARTNQLKTSEPNMPNKVSALFKQALAQINQQEYNKALNLISPLLDSSNQHSSVWVLRGDIAAGQKQGPEQVIQHYKMALHLNPNNYLAHNRLAILATRSGQFKKALSHYQQALDAWPGFALAYLNRGILLDMYLGKKQQALEDYQTYQGLTELTKGKPNKKVRGWIVDLDRQLKQQG